ncbi:hypothetical protein EDB83DRAFT_2386845, partial [Lactarius deliciosus]
PASLPLPFPLKSQPLSPRHCLHYITFVIIIGCSNPYCRRRHHPCCTHRHRARRSHGMSLSLYHVVVAVASSLLLPSLSL